MGSGIGQVFAMAGHEVTLYDVKEEALKKAMEGIRWSLQKLQEKGSVKDVESVLSRIFTSRDLSEARDHLVIEAVFEDIKVKSDVLGRVSPLPTRSLPATLAPSPSLSYLGL